MCARVLPPLMRPTFPSFRGSWSPSRSETFDDAAQRTGSREDLLAALDKPRVNAQQMLGVGRPLAGENLTATHQFQDQVHIRALTFDYLCNRARFTAEWADRTEREVRQRTDLTPTPDKRQRALDHIREIIYEQPRQADPSRDGLTDLCRKTSPDSRSHPRGG